MLASSPTEESRYLFALWVSYFEIYNECVYDLFQPAKKRTALRVCDNGAGDTYVKGVENVQNKVRGVNPASGYGKTQK